MANDVIYSSSLTLMSSYWSGISQSLAKKVIDSYNSMVLDELNSGYSVNYLDLAVMSSEFSKENTPLGYHYCQISRKLDLDYIVVEGILSRYSELIKDSLLRGTTVVVYGIIKFTPRDSCRVSVKSSSRFGDSKYKVRSKLNPFFKFELEKVS